MNCNKIKISLIFILSYMLISPAALAVEPGALTFDQNDCSAAGLSADLLGTGYISDNNSFVPDNIQGSPVYRCSAGGSEAAAAQITRDHTTLTFQHILFAAPELWGMDQELFASKGNKMAASSDSHSDLSFWGDANITQISEETGSNIDMDIYQFVGGVDKAFGRVFLGASLTYAHTENEQGFARSTVETVGVTPYIAYKINDYLFASALAGYLYSHTDGATSNIDMDTHDYLTEANLNAYKVFYSFILKGRVGARYKHTITSLENGFAGRDNSFDELTWVADGEVGYQFTNRLRIYTGFKYEYIDREVSAASSLVHDSLAFMRYGAEYPVTNDLVINAKIQHDLNDEDVDYITGNIGVRLAF